ncbi:hypothetical protein OPT61_g10025 [Boeremia exigua]|uniref:Uncharacterized protein n=1 Tax=Boeremia exigua TaxID=749465 RepID=A0ACC2HRJ2_9PLEO|nr:hypothetical protein OPT61_g10025 [Boeremia exigua]
MNLYWPSCVPYALPNDVAKDPGSIPNQQPQEPGPPISQLDLPTHIYDKTLGETEFRVAYITASRDEKAPVHLTLETHSDDSHPEYETVSYLWGGEDGDNLQRSPIFIGKYWDVSLQTRNCWSMLQFMRPPRGERVVAYLGADLVTKSTPFPYYRALDQLVDASSNQPIFPVDHSKYRLPFDLGDLLQRRYFSRIWIIQELFLPARALIRLGDIDFRIDSSIMDRLITLIEDSREKWEDPAAPWFLFATRQGFSEEDDVFEIYTLLKMTKNSQMSDPRDRLFGIVTLLERPDIRRHFIPDYSLSYLHFCIGLFGYWVLNKGVLHLLYMAKTLTSSDTQGPSWLPDCKSKDLWRDLLSSDPPTYKYRWMGDSDDHTISLSHLLLFDKGTPVIHSFASDSDGMKLGSWSQGSYINRATGGLVVNVRHLFVFEKKPRYIQNNDRFGFLFSIHDATPDQPMALYAFSSVRLDNLVCPHQDRLVMIDCSVPRTGDGSHICMDHMQGNPGVMYLVLRSEPLEHGNPLRSRLLTADLFLFEAREVVWERPHWKIHRRIPHSIVSRSARLKFGSKSATNDICPDPRESVACAIDSLSHTFRSVHLFKSLQIPTDESSIYRCVLETIYEYHKTYFSIKGTWQQIFPNLLKNSDVSDTVRKLCRAALSQQSTRELKETLLASNSGLQAAIHAGYYSIRFSHDEWARAQCYYIFSHRRVPTSLLRKNMYSDEQFFRSISDAEEYLCDICREQKLDRRIKDDYALLQLYVAVDWEWRLDSDSTWHKAAPAQYLFSAKPIYEPDFDRGVDILLRAPYAQVEAFLMEEMEEFLPPLEALINAYSPPLDLDTAWEMVLAGSTEEQKLIGVPKIIGGVKMDGAVADHYIDEYGRAHMIAQLNDAALHQPNRLGPRIAVAVLELQIDLAGREAHEGDLNLVLANANDKHLTPELNRLDGARNAGLDARALEGVGGLDVISRAAPGGARSPNGPGRCR